MTHPRRAIALIGRIATLRGAAGFGWASAISIENGAVASDGLHAIGRPSVVPLDRDLVAIPALTDPHLHLGMLADVALGLDLAHAESLEEVRDAVALRHRAIPDAKWLVGSGLRVDLWQRWPARDEFEDVAPGRPIVLWAHDHHSVWASRVAFELAGITRDTEPPPGGEIGRNGDAVTGVLLENARQLVLRAVPPASEGDRLEAFVRVADRLLRRGVLAVHDPGPMTDDSGLGALRTLRRADELDRLPIDVITSVRRENIEVAIAERLRSGSALASGKQQPRAFAGWLKLFADGTLGSRSAAIAPDGTHHLLLSPAELRRSVHAAARDGFATQIHAIGDLAVHAALDALSGAVTRRFRHRIEHAQLVSHHDISRFASLGVAASVQPAHLVTDAPLVTRWWGGSASARYPWRSFLEAGVLLLVGSDAPVESADPWPNLASAITRVEPRGLGAERLRPSQALRAAALAPAQVIGDQTRGRLVPGSRADIVILRRSRLREIVDGRFTPEAVIAGGVLVAGDLVGWPDESRALPARLPA